MLIQLASLNVGSIRTGYTASASSTTTAKLMFGVRSAECGDCAGTSIRAGNSLPVASVARRRL